MPRTMDDLPLSWWVEPLLPMPTRTAEVDRDEVVGQVRRWLLTDTPLEAGPERRRVVMLCNPADHPQLDALVCETVGALIDEAGFRRVRSWGLRKSRHVRPGDLVLALGQGPSVGIEREGAG